MKTYAVATDLKREEGMVQPLNLGMGANGIDSNFNMHLPDGTFATTYVVN
jgi:hypothetical protein